jgi:hypothetical protein
MYAIHPTITHQLAQDKVQDLHRAAGNTRLHREVIPRRNRLRRRP